MTTQCSGCTRSGQRGSEPSSPNSKPLYQLVYTLLQLIPPGRVTTYSSLARASGLHPRLVGRILASNPRPVVVPCHRVVRSDGSLGGYRYGGPRVKRRLLELEGVSFRNGRVAMDRHFLDVASLLLDP